MPQTSHSYGPKHGVAAYVNKGFTISQGSGDSPPVTSVAGKTGAVILDCDDVTGLDSELTNYALKTDVPGLAPVKSVATRTGAITLSHTDITDWTATLAPYALKTYVDTSVTKINVVSTAPVFSVTSSTIQVMPAGAASKINFDTREFDTTLSFDIVNHRFLPNIPGYYQLNMGFAVATSSPNVYASLYKNGVEYRRSEMVGNQANIRFSIIIHLNGTTDYAEMWGFTSSSKNNDITPAYTSFSGALIQAASS
jgi:hypothetical protein